MRHDVSVAVIASWLPRFEPPVGDCSPEMPYAERLKADLSVDDAETLDVIYARSVADLKPRAVLGSEGYVEDPLDVVCWTLFYEPEDDQGLSPTKVWEVAEDLIVVSAEGRAQWNLAAHEIAFADLLRAGEHRLLRGDPRRPYLTLLLPQGGDTWLAAWGAATVAWQIAGHLLQANELKQLWRNLRRKELRETLEAGLEVVEQHREEWTRSRAGPPNVLKTLERRPWTADDLRMLLGLATTEQAERLLRLYGFRPNAAGEYELSDDDESLVLQTLAFDGSWGRLDPAEEGGNAERRIRTLLETGELPRRDAW